MKNILSASFNFYIQEFLKVMAMSALTYLPLLIIHALIVNYIYEQTRFAAYPGLIGDVSNGIFMLIFLTIAQFPLIKFTLLDKEGEDSAFKNSLVFSLDKVIPLYIFACVYAIGILLGGFMFIVPGLIVLFLFYFAPYFFAENGKSMKLAINRSMKFMKDHFGKALVLIVLLGVLQLVFENILMFLLSFYTDVYFTTLLIKILLLVFLLPMQTIMITNLFIRWRAA